MNSGVVGDVRGAAGAALRRASAAEDLFLGRRLADAPSLVPGLALAALVVAASVLLSDYANSSLGFKGLISTIMTAIVIGLLAGNAIEIPPAFAPGVSFCLTKLLRLGIILMGIRLSVFDVARIGLWGVPIVLICIATGLVLTTYFTYVYARRVAGEAGSPVSRVGAWRLFPVFILGFLGMAVVRSVGDAGIHQGGSALGIWARADWSQTTTQISNAAGYTLAMAMAGVGLGTRLKALKGLGIKPFYVGLFASLVVGVASAVSVLFLGGLVRA